MSVNIVNQDGTLKKIAHGFPQSKFDILKSDIANHIETTDMASRDYEAGDVFIMANGHMVRALTDIDEDTTISASDVEDITITELLAEKANVTDLDDKVDKVNSATNGNLASLNASGNLTDSGWNGAKDTTSISGNPISISGLKSNQLAVNPIITLEPIQAGSGTPSPSNIREISGYDKIEDLSCGKNLVNGFVQRTFSNGVPEASIWRLASNDFIRVKPNTQYTFSATGSNLKIAFLWFLTNAYGSPSYIGNNGYESGNIRTITTPSNANYCIIGVGFNDDSTITPSQISNTQFEEGDEATIYEAPIKTTSISESLGQTVYGGSLDVRTGVLTSNYAEYIFTGNETWVSTFGEKAYTYECLASKPAVSLALQINVFNCECAEPKSADALSLGQSGIAANGNYIFISTDLYANISSFTGKKVIYRVATPIEIQLTPHEISLLKDYAYVSTNGTNIAFNYHNGELASLSDVSQLGETVNELGKATTIYFKTSSRTSDAYGLIQIKSNDTDLPSNAIMINAFVNGAYLFGNRIYSNKIECVLCGRDSTIIANATVDVTVLYILR